MDVSIAIIVTLASLVLGVVVGWWITKGTYGPISTERDGARAEAETWRTKFNEAIVNLAGEAEKNKRLLEVDAQLATERDTSTSLRAEVAAFRRGEQERERAHREQLAQLKDLHAQVESRFGELAGKAVENAHDTFLKRAEEKLGAAGKENVAKLETILQPVQDTLKRYEQGLTDIEKARNDSYGALKQAISDLAQGNDQVRRETQRLANVMSASPKARGRWGEEQLKNILEANGLAENIDFQLQSSVSDGEKHLRPDCVVTLPGDRCIVIDVKNVWTSFEQAYDEQDEKKRAELLLQHANAMKATALDLSRKGYWKHFDKSPEFVIMFVPGEHVLAAAAERAPDMIESAARNGVLIASTINMLALAKIMAGFWRQETLRAQAKEIAETGRELYRRLLAMGGHIALLGKRLGQAADSYNDFVGSLERKVITQAQRFEALGVDTGGKSIEPMPVINLAPKPLAKLDATIMQDEGQPQIAAE